MDFNNNPYNQNNSTTDNNPYGYQYTPPVRIPGNGFANAAMILGIISIVTAIMLTLYFPFALGSLAILFALLSKGRAPKMQGRAKAGIICGTIGLAINISIFVSSICFVLSNPDLLIESAQMYDDMFEQMYGQPSEDILGDSMEDIISNMFGR